MVSLQEGAREFVGFVWFDGDWLGSQEGILIEASDVREARHIVEEFFGPNVGISLWSEEDAGRPRSIPWARLRAGGGDAGRVGEDLEMLLFAEGAEDDGAYERLENELESQGDLFQCAPAAVSVIVAAVAEGSVPPANLATCLDLLGRIIAGHSARSEVEVGNGDLG